jgi:branched-chain amino acid transport system substrate-binding protein
MCQLIDGLRELSIRCLMISFGKGVTAMTRTQGRPGWRSRYGQAILGAAVTLSLVVTGCSSAAEGDSGQTSTKTVKIGVLLPYTGAFGLYGKPMEAALRARLAAANGQVDGHKVELVFEDEATDAGTAVTKASKLIDQEGVSAIVCCATGAATLAVGPILAERGIPQLGPIPNPSGLDKYSTAAVAAPTAGHDATELGKYAATTLGYKRAVVAASDFSYGHEVAAGFSQGFTDAGGTIVKSVYAPLGTTDFGSYLTQLGDADVAFAGFAGADAIGFVKQYQQFGLKAKMPLIGHGPLVTELLLKAEGPASVGVGAGFYYSSSLDNAENTAFKAALKQVSPDLVPSHFTAGAWASMGVLLDAIHRMNGKVSDGKKFAAAIRQTHIDTPWGPLAFDQKTGYAIAPTYYYVVVSDAQGVHHKILGEIK